MVRIANAGSRMGSLMRTAADRPVWSWLAIPLLALTVYAGAFDVQAPLPLWILVAPVWACAVAADLYSTWNLCGNKAYCEVNPVLSWVMGRFGVKRAIMLYPFMYAAILATLPLGLEFVGEHLRVEHDAARIAGILLPFLAGGHVWCAGVNTRLYRRLDA